MSYPATVFKVMIASPGDVKVEREIIRDVIHEWNVVHSSKNKVVLLPVGWETHTTPEMGKPPQEAINDQILRDCDMLIGVFWTRLGTPTGKAASGTVEEINEFINASKPVMLYFSNQPVAPASVDPEQLEAVRAFKEEVKSRGLFSEYGSCEEFQGMLMRQLAQTVERNILPLCPQQEILEEQLSVTTNLPEEARQLLVRAVEGNGSLQRYRASGGTTIETNDFVFYKGNDRRESAKWEDGMNKLIECGYLVGRGDRDFLYEVTKTGYDAAEKLKKS